MSQKIKQNVKTNKILQTKSFKTKEKCSGGGGGGGSLKEGEIRMYKNENFETADTTQILLFSSLGEREIKGSVHFRNKAGRKMESIRRWAMVQT